MWVVLWLHSPPNVFPFWEKGVPYLTLKGGAFGRGELKCPPLKDLALLVPLNPPKNSPILLRPQVVSLGVGWGPGTILFRTPVLAWGGGRPRGRGQKAPGPRGPPFWGSWGPPLGRPGPFEGPHPPVGANLLGRPREKGGNPGPRRATGAGGPGPDPGRPRGRPLYRDPVH